jgi:hypothetical protein
MRIAACVTFGLAATLLGCSGSALQPSDAAALDAPPPSGRRSFVVTSMLTQDITDGGAAPLPLPSEHRFTMVLDWDGTWAIMGASGSGANGPNGTSARFQPTSTGGTINQSGLTIQLGTGIRVAYDSIELAVTDAGLLTGTARGQAWYQPPTSDVVSGGAVKMSLRGVPDTEPPSLVANVGGAPINPFADVRVAASEPLPPTTRLALVDLRGDRFELAPPNDQAIAAFTFARSPIRMLRYGEQYSLLIDGVVDFAGNATTSGTITFTTIAPPPIAPEDGFESASGPTFASAQVLSGSGGPTITGARSLYIPSVPSVMPPGGRAEMTQLAVRVALEATDTVVRFSYRSVNPQTGIGPDPSFVFGAPGSEIKGMQLGADSGPPVSATIGLETVMLGPVMTAELVLPAGAAAAGELAIVRTLPACCYGSPSPPVPGLILDDLRAE